MTDRDMEEIYKPDTKKVEIYSRAYIKNLRKKLRLDCIVTVKGIGYKYEVQP